MSKLSGAQKGGVQTVHYTIRKLEYYTGDAATIYAVWLNDDEKSEYKKFCEIYLGSYKDDVKFLITTLKIMANSVGVVDKYFRLYEATGKRYVACLPNKDEPNPPLRLFCIPYPNDNLILVGGGRKEAETWQDSPELLPYGNLTTAIYDDLNNKKLYDYQRKELKIEKLYAQTLKVDLMFKK